MISTEDEGLTVRPKTSLICAASSCIRAGGRSYPVGRGPQPFFEEFAMLLRRERKARVRHLAALRAPADSAAINKSSRASAPMVARCSANSVTTARGIENGCSVEESESIVVELLGGR